MLLRNTSFKMTHITPTVLLGLILLVCCLLPYSFATQDATPDVDIQQYDFYWPRDCYFLDDQHGEPDPQCQLEGVWLRRPGAACGRYVSRYTNVCACDRLLETGLPAPCWYQAGQAQPYWPIGGEGDIRGWSGTPQFFERPCDIPQPDVQCVYGTCNQSTSKCDCDNFWWAGPLCQRQEQFYWRNLPWSECHFPQRDPSAGYNPFTQKCGTQLQTRGQECVAYSTSRVVPDEWCLGTATAPNDPNFQPLQPSPDIPLTRACEPVVCTNGGQCDSQTNQCRCPIGTRGDLCEEHYTPEYKWDYTEWSNECHNIYPTQKCGVQAKYRKARCYETYYNITIDDVTKCFESSVAGISDVLFNTTSCGEIVKSTSPSSQPQQSNVCGLTSEYHGYCTAFDDHGNELVERDDDNDGDNHTIPTIGGVLGGKVDVIELINNYTLNPHTINNYVNTNLLVTNGQGQPTSNVLLDLPFFDCSCQVGLTGDFCQIAQPVQWVVTEWSECQLQRNEFSASCGRPHRTRQVTCQFVHDGTVLSNDHPSCLAIAFEMPANIDFTTCSIDVTHTCQNGGVCIEKNNNNNQNNNNNHLDVFWGNAFTPAFTLQPLECQCPPGWSGILCENVLNMTQITIQPNNNDTDDRQQEETNQPPQEEIIPKKWSISRWTQCMLPWEYQMMLDSTAFPGQSKGCDEYKRYRNVTCVIDDTNNNSIIDKNNKKKAPPVVVNDDECFAYYQHLVQQQNDRIAKDDAYIPIPISTTKPLQEESCFMFYPPCAGQQGSWVGIDLTNADHIVGDDYLDPEDGEDKTDEQGSTAITHNSSIHIMIITVTVMMATVFLF